MRILTVFISILIPIIGTAQMINLEKGIHFEQGLTWDEIKAKAKETNKYIFLDCYTTWCAPCKQMDKVVYQNEKVGNSINKKFISVKVQMDTGKNDNEEIKEWYKSAHDIQNGYLVNAYPTFLFFSPDGKIVHRYTGFLNDSNFVNTAKDALDPDRQIYTLLEKYKQGAKNYGRMKYMARVAFELGEKKLSDQIARDYIENFLNNQPDNVILSKTELQFLLGKVRLLNSSDRPFKLFLNDPGTINKLMGQKDVAQYMVSSVITKEEINPVLWPENKAIDHELVWNALYNGIKKKYNKFYAEKVILDSKLKWYEEKQDWPNIVKYNIENVERNGVDTSGINKYMLNNMIWDVIFLHSNKKEDLNKAINWMELILKAVPGEPIPIDTYANLLYKSGRKREALLWQQKAVAIENEHAKKRMIEPNKSFAQTLQKMINGEPTWLE